jgi:hypothetical protein
MADPHIPAEALDEIATVLIEAAERLAEREEREEVATP